MPFTTTTFCQEGTITSRRCLNDAKTCLWIVWGGTGSVSTDFQWSPFIWKFIIYEECYSLFEKKLIFKREIQVHFVTRVELLTYLCRWKLKTSLMTWKRKWIKLQARNDDMTLLNYQHICCFIISKRLLEYKLTLSYFWTLNDYFMIMAISVSLSHLPLFHNLDHGNKET